MTDEKPRTSTRDHELLQHRLGAWLAIKLPGATLTDFTVPATNGMSSETILFSVSWSGDDGSAKNDRLVLRLPPDPQAQPVFPIYDMPRQYRAMQLVEARTDVPVPPTLWLETDPGPLGAPFFVMRCVEGVVPPDLAPYTFGDNWLFDATPQEQATLQHASIEVLAKIHSIPADDPEAAFLRVD